MGIKENIGKLFETGIPKIFWLSVSICLLTVTFGFMYLAYHSASVSLEIANTKIEMIKSISEIEKTYNALNDKEKILNRVQAELEKTHEALVVATTRPALIQPSKPQIDKKLIESIKIEREVLDKSVFDLKATQQQMIEKK
jgi:hypothetical protein